jgi:hypothetical protein
MGSDGKSKAVTDKSPREILDAIDKALEETAARLTAKPKPVLYPPPSPPPAVPGRPKTSREILDAIDRALEETARRLADRRY